MTSRAGLHEALKAVGAQPDEAIDLAGTALILGALDLPDVPLEPYREHLARLATDMGAVAAAEDRLEDRVECLNTVLFKRHGYAGDAETYDDADNANLLRVIDRHAGLPVSLGILYIHAARTQDWPVSGLAFPGHFLVRLDDGARRAIVDPFHGGQGLEAGHLRDLLKQFLGADAELEPAHYAPVGNRAILLRLLNNIKARALQQDDAARAVAITQRMATIAPDAANVWHELGLLQARVGNLGGAISALETCVDCADIGEDRRQAIALLEKLRTSLH